MPTQEPTNQELLAAIQGLGTNVQDLARQTNQENKNTNQRIDNVLEAVNSFATHVEQRFTGVDQRFESIDQQFVDIRSEMATKMATKEDLSNLKSDLVTEIDRFVVLHQTLDVELVALRSRCERMESFMAKVAKQLNLDFQIT